MIFIGGRVALIQFGGSLGTKTGILLQIALNLLFASTLSLHCFILRLICLPSAPERKWTSSANAPLGAYTKQSQQQYIFIRFNIK